MSVKVQDNIYIEKEIIKFVDKKGEKIDRSRNYIFVKAIKKGLKELYNFELTEENK